MSCPAAMIVGIMKVPNRIPFLVAKLCTMLGIKPAASKTTIVSFPPIAAPREISKAYMP